MLEQKELVRYIADILRQARMNKGYTLEKLAERSEMDYSTVSLIENSKQNPRIYSAYKLLYALDIDIVSLLNAKNKDLQDRKALILNRLENLDLQTLECISEFLEHFTISKRNG